MRSPLNRLASAAAAFALCASPVVAAPTTVQPLNPLVAVSVFGTQASAQAVCSQGSAAGAAIAAQGQSGCVLPATDAAVPAGEAAAPLQPVPAGDFGINWPLLALGSLALLGGIYTLFADDDDDGALAPISPA